MIKKAKNILTNQEYMHLQFSYGQGGSCSQMSLNKAEEHAKIAIDYIDEREKKGMDEVLALNKRRLKMERQRVILKLRC